VLLDRDAELAALASELTAARNGSGRVVVVEGPAGIGKTSLLAAAAETARAAGTTVLRARAGPLEQAFSFGVARQLFAPLRGTPLWSDLSAGAAGLASRALDETAPEPAGAEDAIHAAAHGLVWLAVDLADRAPAALVVDDLQWADPPSLRWLAQLARRVDELPLALVCALRTGEPPEDPRLLAELLAVAGTPIRPRPLGPEATEALVRTTLPDATPAFAEACHAACAGNPFLLRALLAQLAAERVEPTQEAAERLTTFGPEQVARSVALQLERLPEGAAQLARALAVLDAPAPLRHAAEVAELDPVQAAHLADALRACALVGEGEELALAHPIVSAALYNALPRGERGLWHARAARLLAAKDADPERVALHLLRTEPAGDRETVAALRAAAGRATSRGAPDAAARYLRRALDEPPDRADDATVRLELGLALAAELRPGSVELLQEAVELSDDAAVRADAGLRGVRTLALASYVEEATRIGEATLASPAGMPGETVARLEAEVIAMGLTTTATRPIALRRFRHRVARTDTLELWRVNTALVATLEGGPGREALDVLTPALGATALGAERDTVLYTVAGFVLVANDAAGEAAALSSAAIESARPRGWQTTVAHACFMRGIARRHQGAIREAEADARFSFEFKIGTLHVPLAVSWTLAVLLEVLVEADRLEEADDAIRLAALPEPLDRTIPSAALLQARGPLRRAQGRDDDALADLRDAAARWDELGMRHPVWADWRVAMVELLVDRGEDSEARRLAAEQLALADRVGTPGAVAAALRTEAMVAPRRERVALLERAVAVSAESQAQLEHCRALVDLGAALRRAGRRADARDPLRRALDLANRGGAVRLARRAHEELRAAGAKPRRAALSGPESLTGAEHRVATLAAQGHTNRQIAQALFVSRRTVETHLAHAFQKLGVSGRDELASRLADEHAAAAPRVPALAAS
jgi:DNA-binding CsgD family transcriptional regulator